MENNSELIQEENIDITQYKNKWNKALIISIIINFVIILAVILLSLYNNLIYQVIGRLFIAKTSAHYNSNLYCEKIGLIIFLVIYVFGFTLLVLELILYKITKLDDKDYVWFIVKGKKKKKIYKELYQEDKHTFTKGAKWINIVKNILDYYIVVMAAVLTVIFVFSFILFPAIVNQSSMENTLYDGNRVVVLVTKKIEKGDVVVFKYQNEIQKKDDRLDGDLLIKRVIASSGDTFKCVDGKIYVNDVLLNEDYVHEYNVDHDSYTLEDIASKNTNKDELLKTIQENGGKVPEGYYIFLGDNRSISNDSENFGLIKKSQILGLVKVYHNEFGWHKMN